MARFQFSFSIFVVGILAFVAVYIVEGYYEDKNLSAASVQFPRALPAQEENHSVMQKISNIFSPAEPAVFENTEPELNFSPEENALEVHHGLCVAAMTGDLTAVREFLEKGVSANARDAFGIRAIARATLWGHFDVVKILLEQGAKVNEPERLGVSLLMLAANQGDESLVKLFLEFGADVNARSQDGETAASAAAKKGNRNILELLERAGADVSDFQPTEEEPIVVSRLLQKHRDNDSSTAPSEPVDEDLAHIAKTLAEFNARKKQLREPMPEQKLPETGIEAEPAPMNNSVQAEQVRPDSLQTLKWAADISEESIKTVESEMVQEIMEREKAKESALRRVMDRPAPAPLLEKEGPASVDASQEIKITAHKENNEDAAVLNEFSEVEESSKMDWEADLDALMKEAAALTETPLFDRDSAPRFAKEENTSEPSPAAVAETVIVPQPARVDLPVQKPLSAETAGPASDNEQMIRVKSSSPAIEEIVRPRAAVREVTPDQDVKDMEKAVSDPRITAALFSAIINGDYSRAKQLIHAGATVNARGDLDMTPLMVAAQGGNTKIVQLLLEHHADVHARNIVGQTALRLAMLKEREQITTLLREQGATA